MAGSDCVYRNPAGGVYHDRLESWEIGWAMVVLLGDQMHSFESPLRPAEGGDSRIGSPGLDILFVVRLDVLRPLWTTCTTNNANER
jgi:hypothetical protein